MSDLVVLMNHGRIVQTGAPRELYSEPANVFVADFIGDSNLLDGNVTAVKDGTITVALDAGAVIEVARRDSISHAPGRRVVVMLRPEDITVHAPGMAARVSLSGKVAEIGYQGDSCRLSVTVGGEAIKVRVPSHLALAVHPGLAVQLSWESSAVRLLSLGHREKA